MKLYLQFGHGMMGLCKDLLPHLNNSAVILSPRDLDESQIEKFSTEVIKSGGQTFFDPQLYAPRCDHKKLTNHTYWPNGYETGAFLSNSSSLKVMISKLIELNKKAKTESFILPGLYCSRVEKTWIDISDNIINSSSLYDGKRIGTLCLSSETLRFEDQLDELLTKTEEWGLDGYYVIAEHPNGDYLVEDPIWLSNLLSFCAGLKLQGHKVILGYSNHQMLCCVCSGIDALATGSWMNVRSFNIDKFWQQDPDDIKRKRTWYYCPQALSEYKPEFLDLAFRRDVLPAFASNLLMNSTYANILFSGAIPTTTNYREPDSFKHYLMSLYYQCEISSKGSFSECIDHQRKILKIAKKMIEFSHNYGVRGQKRDFEECVEVNLSALDTFEAEKGFLLRKMWN